MTTLSLPLEVALTADEVRLCEIVADLREAEHKQRGTVDRYGWDPKLNSRVVRVQSSCAELAVAKTVDCYWPIAFTKPVVPDLTGTEVMWVSKENYHLLVHPGDRGNYRWVLVSGIAPRMKILGWAWLQDIKVAENWASWLKRPCYLLPNHLLHREAWWV